MYISSAIIYLFEKGLGTSDISETLCISKSDIEKAYTKEAKNFIAVDRATYEWTDPN